MDNDNSKELAKELLKYRPPLKYIEDMAAATTEEVEETEKTAWVAPSAPKLEVLIAVLSSPKKQSPNWARQFVRISDPLITTTLLNYETRKPSRKEL